ncbi:MAG: hypothetical protein M9898_10535 [Chitinophagaceae bacterium]|nr:hypothetical protein [Chitinophagaceae bacterium]
MKTNALITNFKDLFSGPDMTHEGIAAGDRSDKLLFSPSLYFDDNTSGMIVLLLSGAGSEVNPHVFNLDGVNQFARNLGLLFVAESTTGNVCYAEENAEMRDEFRQVFTAADLRDYLYGVLLYALCDCNKETDFIKAIPGLPNISDALVFWKLSRLGGDLRMVHLLKCNAVMREVAVFSGDDDMVTSQISWVTAQETVFTPAQGNASGMAFTPYGQIGKVYINDHAYFDGVPEVVWKLQIGKYRPAQKWLTDHIGQRLTTGEIRHYQQMVAALLETIRLFEAISKTLSTIK